MTKRNYMQEAPEVVRRAYFANQRIEITDGKWLSIQTKI